MKSQPVILLILVSSLLATNADQQCDNLLQQYNQKCIRCSPIMRSCCDLAHLPHYEAPSGVYQLMYNCSNGSPFRRSLVADAYCDRDCDEEWMVIQRNVKDGVNTFHKQWKDFEEGFGDLKSSKFWYGLKAIHCFTWTSQWELRIDFQFENETWSHLHYNTFSVGTESREYPLTIGGFTGNTLTDPFVTHPLNGQRFTTFDNDNDRNGGNCAASHNNGWWYNNCDHINPNLQPPFVYLSSKSYNLLSMEMKIRPRDCIIQWLYWLFIVSTCCTSIRIICIHYQYNVWHIMSCTICYWIHVRST